MCCACEIYWLTDGCFVALQWLETPEAKRLRMESTAGDDAGVFGLLSVQVETLYSELETVLCEAGLLGSDGNTAMAVKQGGQVKTDAKGGMLIEVMDCFVFPF